MTLPVLTDTLTSAHKRAVHRALARGRDLHLPNTAVFLPNEQVRCTRPRFCKELAREEVCGAYVCTNGPDTALHVRLYNPAQFNAPRGTPRLSTRCSSRGCLGQLDIEVPPCLP